jgi:hypothetical protein
VKITATNAKYLIKVGNNKLLLEDITNERGERLLVVTTLRKYKLSEEQYWEPKADDAKEVKREELPDEIKKALRVILSLS